VPALEAIVLALPAATFEFADGARPDERVEADDHLAEMPFEALGAHLEELVAEQGPTAAVLLTPSATFSVTELEEPPEAPARSASGEAAHATPQLVLSRNALAVLLAIYAGRRRLVDLAAERGLLPAVRAVIELQRLGLIRIDLPLTDAPRAGT
jgi:hypothetical protein